MFGRGYFRLGVLRWVGGWRFISFTRFFDPVDTMYGGGVEV